VYKIIQPNFKQISRNGINLDHAKQDMEVKFGIQTTVSMTHMPNTILELMLMLLPEMPLKYFSIPQRVTST